MSPLPRQHSTFAPRSHLTERAAVHSVCNCSDNPGGEPGLTMYYWPFLICFIGQST
jgi:hypothetical protein